MLICAILVSADVLASYRPELPVATPADGAAYLVTDILPRYVEEHPDHPPLDSDLEVELGEVSDGYVAPREDVPSARIRLKRQRDRGPVRFYASALAAINRSIVGQLNRRGLAGIRVQTDPSDIDPVTGEDRRAPGQRSVHLDIATGRISGLRAVEVEAFGLRAGEESSSDSPFHRRVLEGSPIQPRDSAREGTTDLLRIDKLEDYVAQLNRYPSRAVVAEITPGWITPESTYLDYKIIEERPWTLYSQVSRSGTEETHRWRQRFGFRHTQLRGGDDTLRVDYVTGGKFKDVHGFLASYESPLPGQNRLRWQANLEYGEYDASEFGITNANLAGRQHAAGLQLIANVFQHRQLFVDLVGEVRWQDFEVEDQLRNTDGDEDMFVPRLILRSERRTDSARFHLNLGIERSLGGGSSLRKSDLQLLGRVDPDDRWKILRWEAGLSFFLEPILARRLPGLVDGSRRAHEVYLSSRGQDAFDNRLIPQEEMIVGGLYTVRGYPQATLAGDSVAMASAEYRLHLGSLLQLKELPFDWDLVLSAFVDLARVRQSQKVPGEVESTLFGSGLAVELRILRNLRVRYDFGFALRDLEGPGGTRDIVERGDAEHYLSFTVLY